MSCDCDRKEECEFCIAGDARLALKAVEACMVELIQALDGVVAVCDEKQKQEVYSQARRRLSTVAAAMESAKAMPLPPHLLDIYQGYERVQREIAKMENTMNWSQREK